MKMNYDVVFNRLRDKVQKANQREEVDKAIKDTIDSLSKKDLQSLAYTDNWLMTGRSRTGRVSDTMRDCLEENLNEDIALMDTKIA